jgi:ribosomal protein L24
MKLKKWDWVYIVSGPLKGKVGEITDIGPGEYHVAVDEINEFHWFTEEQVMYYGRL